MMTVEIANLHGRIMDETGRKPFVVEDPVVQKGPDGQLRVVGTEPRSDEDQPTIGSMMLEHLFRMSPADGKEAWLLGKVRRKLGDAYYENKSYVAGEPAVALIRKALTQNKPSTIGGILDQLWAVVGTGEDEEDEKDPDVDDPASLATPASG